MAFFFSSGSLALYFSPSAYFVYNSVIFVESAPTP